MGELAFWRKMGSIDEIHGGRVNDGWLEAQKAAHDRASSWLRKNLHSSSLIDFVPMIAEEIEAVSVGTDGVRVLVVRAEGERIQYHAIHL